MFCLLFPISFKVLLKCCISSLFGQHCRSSICPPIHPCIQHHSWERCLEGYYIQFKAMIASRKYVSVLK